MDDRLLASSEARHRYEVLLLAWPQLHILLSQETPLKRNGLAPNHSSQQIVPLGICLRLYLRHLLETSHFIIWITAEELTIDLMVLTTDFDHGVPHIIAEVVTSL